MSLAVLGRWSVILLVVAALVSMPTRACGSDPRYGYRAEWRKFGAVDYVVTGVLVAGVVTLELTQSGPTEPTWTEPVPLIDRAVREVVVGPSREARVRATKISDWLWHASVVYPIFDVLLTPPLRNASHDVVWQMTMMNVQAYATVALLVRAPQKWIGRTRPTVVGCKEDPEYSSQCDKSISLVSYPGGHFGASMAGAGLTCAHHLHGELYGGAADVIACGSALGAASMVGYLRLYADEHWLSDQLIGGATGLFSGYVLPTLLYYRPFWRDASDAKGTPAPASSHLRWTIVPNLTPDTLGLSLLLLEGG